MRTLVLLVHPRPDRSDVNRPLFEVARQVAGVTAVDLYATYPDFHIDVDREQDRLRDHDAIVFQHPVYWYSAPALLKEWLDLVLEHGFAYGHGERALTGKLLVNAVSSGGNRDAYTKHGANHTELKDMLVPFRMTADLCRMRYLAPFALFGAGRAAEEGRLGQHLEEYQRFLEAMVADRIDIGRAVSALTINEAFDQIVRSEAPV